MRFIAHSPIFRPMLAGVVTLNFFNFAFATLFLLFATGELDIEPGTLGAVLGAGLGGIRPLGSIATVAALGGLLALLPSPIPSLRDLPEEAV